jgi:hypothetical protein
MRFLVYFLSLVISFQSVSDHKTETPPEQIPDEDYVVYSLVLQNQFAKDGIERIVIGDHTLMDLPPIMMGMTQFGGSPEVKKIREAMDKETWNDYEQKSKSPVALANKFTLKIPVVLISAAERDRVFSVTGEGEKKVASPQGIKEFQKLYPNSPGFMHISRIGYNRDRTQSFLYVGYVCGGLCGSGQIFLLAKEKDQWKILHTAMTWIS